MRNSYALINLNNLKFNYFNLRNKVSPAKFLAVVKADAYGHGAVEISKFLSKLNPKPDYFGVAFIEEAIELRNFGVKTPILVFDVINFNSLQLANQFDITLSITHASDLNKIKNYLKKFKLKQNLKFHIKINTGMNRLGIRWDDKIDDIIKFFNIDKIDITGIYTHFATSDIPESKFALTQLNRFKEIINHLKSKSINPGIVHAANSGAILNLPDSTFDMVRSGISLYGYKPALESLDTVKLKPVMSIISEVASINKVRKGESISYGQKYFFKSNSKIATVAFGYADGYIRALTNKGKAIIKNKFYNQVGTVTMDRIIFDIKDDKISVGDKVILLGQKNNLKFDAWDWSLLLNTIPYEITCNISKRVPRIFKV